MSSEDVEKNEETYKFIRRIELSTVLTHPSFGSTRPGPLAIRNYSALMSEEQWRSFK